TNIGSDIIQDSFRNMNGENDTETIDKTKLRVFELLKSSVRPEFLNRIDEVVMFRPLSNKDIRKIVDIQFRIIQKRLLENNIKIEAADNVLDLLGKLGYDPQFGARPLKRVLQREILNKLSREILSGDIKPNSIVGITLTDSREIEFINLDKIEI